MIRVKLLLCKLLMSLVVMDKKKISLKDNLMILMWLSNSKLLKRLIHINRED